MLSKPEMRKDLSDLTDAEILKLRFRDISLSITRTEIEEQIKQLYTELDAKGLKFRPQVFLGDEWFSPEGMNAISVPFYLANTRLKNLEKSLMLDVEGGNPEWFMKLLRHEAGHCFDHCFRFSKRKKWHQVFGSPSKEYEPEKYRPQPFSKSYVRHLDGWYAQAHPDEDFAETFAVWLDPLRDWKKEYSKWPVTLAKLEYMELLAKESVKLKVLAEKGRVPSAVARLSTTLGKYYQKRRREQADEYPDFYDSDLKKIFNGAVLYKPKTSHDASIILHSNKQPLTTKQRTKMLLTKSTQTGGTFGGSQDLPAEYFRRY